MADKKRGIHELYNEDPIEADDLVWGRKCDPITRRGLLEFEIHRLVDQTRSNLTIPHEQQPIVLYCGTGGRSALAAKAVEELGYTNVRSMAGGIVAWAQAQLPLKTCHTAGP